MTTTDAVLSKVEPETRGLGASPAAAEIGSVRGLFGDWGDQLLWMILYWIWVKVQGQSAKLAH